MQFPWAPCQRAGAYGKGPPGRPGMSLVWDYKKHQIVNLQEKNEEKSKTEGHPIIHLWAHHDLSTLVN